VEKGKRKEKEDERARRAGPPKGKREKKI